MRLAHGLHLAYCTNVHRGETWEQTLHSLNTDTLEVRARVAAGLPYAIGLRLSERAARELAQPPNFAAFKQWLERNDCYVFTINGFPYGQFHGTRVKENVFRPDWSTPERLAYTNLLFDLLAELLPPGMEGSVSTLPGSFKEFALDAPAQTAIRRNFWLCLAHVGDLYERTGKIMHLGVEPEPLGLFETSAETVLFVQQLRADHGFDIRLDRHFGVNYDACHLAVEFEEPADALKHFRQNNIRISKLHITSALRLRPTPETLAALAAFADDIYLHQVVEQGADRTLRRYRDLPDALAAARANPPAAGTEWRVHFHIPLHTQPTAEFENTSDHVTGLFDALKLDPQLCRHLEMETYTWEVLPPQFKDLKLVDQLAAEYRWTLEQLRQRGLSA